MLIPAGLATTPASAATSPIQFSGWQADYRGTSVADTHVTAAMLNGEYITLTNTSSRTVTIGRYKVSDAGNKHVYTIPTGFKLGAKRSVVIYSGKGRNTATALYWGQSVSGVRPVSRNNFVWNNKWDVATLRDASGRSLDVCTYTKRASGFVRC